MAYLKIECIPANPIYPTKRIINTDYITCISKADYIKNCYTLHLLSTEKINTTAEEVKKIYDAIAIDETERI